jgi:hypothetical protein
MTGWSGLTYHEPLPVAFAGFTRTESTNNMDLRCGRIRMIASRSTVTILSDLLAFIAIILSAIYRVRY